MPDMPGAQTIQHFKYLDSARGIAALMVFGSHYIARHFQDKMDVHYFFFLFNGNDAVSFFFVLSGFVLSYKYIVLGKPLDVKQFYVSRVFRLFPAYFLLIVVTALYTTRYYFDAKTLTDIFLYNKNGFWNEALLFRFHNTLYYPGWTLTIEMLGSFLMPFYIALAIKNRKLIPYFIVVTLIIGNNINFSYLFFFGIIASAYYGEITGAAFTQTKWYKYKYLILALAIALFSIRQLDSVLPFGKTYHDLTYFLGIDFFTYTGLSCFVFLVAILRSKAAQRVLEHRFLVYLGKISYGIYLVHIIVLEVLYNFMQKYVPQQHSPVHFIIGTIVCFFCVVLAATAMHYWVELPFMRLGRRITNRMKPSLIISRDKDTRGGNSPL
jgi:peptidoglycan/LPS O-acetylase OafA/YrhL